MFLASYFGGRTVPRHRRLLYLLYRRAFLLKNRSKQRVRGSLRRFAEVVLPRRGGHPHLASAHRGADSRGKAVWDQLSDQPFQHAGRLEKLAVRLRDGGLHLAAVGTLGTALPRIVRRYRQLERDLYARPSPFGVVGIGISARRQDNEEIVLRVRELGVRHVLLRLHPWQEDHGAEEELARALAAREIELSFALPQTRELVVDAPRWRAAVEELVTRFSPYGKAFQVGQAMNRSKWGIWNAREYLELAESAIEILRRFRGCLALGPAVIDFEFHHTAMILNTRRPAIHFDVVSSLLYVDRRGAPENRQAGFDTPHKVALLKAIAETAITSSGRCWITEVNWPLREGPHSPAGRDVAVDEESQADYLARYYVLVLATGLVERVYWWQLAAKGYGLIDPIPPAAWRKRPAFATLKTLHDELSGRTFRELRSTPETRLFRFSEAAGEEVVVGWSLGADGAQVRLERPPSVIRGRDGATMAVANGRDVTLTPSPTYFHLSPV
jgi:hypothetical protein